MNLMMTLVWREWRDHRRLVLAAFLLGPLLIWALQVGLSGGNAEYLAGTFMVPALVLLFGGLLGADQFTRESVSGVGSSMAQLPISKWRSYSAKLLFLMTGMLTLDAWAIGFESTRLALFHGDVAAFEQACFDGIVSHGVALCVGIGSFAFGTWIKHTPSALIMSIMTIVLVPYAFLANAPVSTQLALARPMSNWPVGVWFAVVCLAFVVAGFGAWNGRSIGARFGFLGSFRFVGFGMMTLVLAGGAAVAQGAFERHGQTHSEPIAEQGRFSPDGSLLMLQVVNVLPSAGVASGLWSEVVQAKLNGKGGKYGDSYSVWVFDVEAGERLAVLDGYGNGRWKTDGALELVQGLGGPGFQREDVLATWSAEGGVGLSVLSGDDQYVAWERAAFSVEWDQESQTEGRVTSTLMDHRSGAEVVFKDCRSRVRLVHGRDAVVFVNGGGELIRRDMEGVQGERVIRGAIPGSGKVFPWLSSDGKSVMIHWTDEAGEKGLLLIDLETGAEIPVDRTGDDHFIGWTQVSIDSERSLPVFLEREAIRKQGSLAATLRIADGDRSLTLPAMSASSYSTLLSRPGGGFVTINSEQGWTHYQVLVLDEAGEVLRELAGFTP